jgi:hypothetical protein
MQKDAWLCLTLTLGAIACAGESPACWLRWHAGRWHAPCPPCPRPACYAPVVSARPAPVVLYGMAPAQPPPRADAAQAQAAPRARVRTFVFKGKTYQAVPTDERGESEEEELRVLPPSLARARASDGEHFAGRARKAAKTSFAVAPVESFSSPGALIDSILRGTDPADNDREMRRKLNADSPRAPEERRNVTVTAYLYATKKETDNDFHLLIGDDPGGGDGRFLTAEVSGLPNPDDDLTPQFRKVRDQFKAFFAATGQELPGDRYVRFRQPIPVTVTGSVFFDVDHKIGEVFSGNIRPETVWEIHPVSDLAFGTDGVQ